SLTPASGELPAIPAWTTPARFLAAAPAALTLLLRTSFADSDGSSIHLVLVEHRDGLLRLLLSRHFDKGKASGLARGSVSDHTGGFNLSRATKHLFQFRIGHLKGQVSYV